MTANDSLTTLERLQIKYQNDFLSALFIHPHRSFYRSSFFHLISKYLQISASLDWEGRRKFL